MMKVDFFPITRRIIILYYYKNIHLNPGYWYKLLYFYRFMLGFLIVCTIIKDNSIYIYGLLYELNINYFNDLFFDSLYVNMIPGEIGSSYGQEFPVNVLMDANYSLLSGPSGPSGPGGNNPLGVGSTIEDENSRNRGYEFKMKYRLKPDAHTPAYRYYDSVKRRWIHPEVYHDVYPIVTASKTMRVYDEAGIRWTYMCSDYDENKRYCVITYPDGTKAYLYDKPTVMKNIEFHKRHIAMNYQVNPPINYVDYYKEHFDGFRKDKIRREFFEGDFPSEEPKKKKLFID